MAVARWFWRRWAWLAGLPFLTPACPGTSCHALSKQYGWGMSLALRCQPGQQKDGPMSFQKTPGGTRGARVPSSNAVTRALNRVAMSWHRRSGDRFQGQDLLYLTTVGAKTGQKRQTAVARFPDGEDAWLGVAPAARRSGERRVGEEGRSRWSPCQ